VSISLSVDRVFIFCYLQKYKRITNKEKRGGNMGKLVSKMVSKKFSRMTNSMGELQVEEKVYCLLIG
jgi:hypothetical protein